MSARRRTTRWRLAGASLLALAADAALLTGRAGAQGPAPAPSASVDDAGAGGSVTGCVESIPKGAERPGIIDVFPERGTSGWAATLKVTVTHGKGERVLPSGLDLSSAADAKKYLKQAGFAVPVQDAGAGAHLYGEPDDPQKTRSVTHLEIPLVTLPEGPGRNVMHLPPLPIAIARSNGEIATVCTHLHTIVVDDPIANVPNAEPKLNPAPRPQREEWTALKKGLLWGGLGVLIGAVVAYLVYRHLSRPKPPPPPPPPRPAWEVALEKLDEVRHAGLLEAGRHGEYFDRVSDAVRGYLGARFGFDGLESTTDEILAALRQRGEPFVHLEEAEQGDLRGGISYREVQRFLAECDLVKFANLTPSPDQCAHALGAGVTIVRATSALGGAVPAVPAPVVAAPAPPPTPVAENPDAAWMPPAPPTESTTDTTRAKEAEAPPPSDEPPAPADPEEPR